MKRFAKFLISIIFIAGMATVASSCMRQDYFMFEDGDFDGADFMDMEDYNNLHNAEIDMDDTDRQ